MKGRPVRNIVVDIVMVAAFVVLYLLVLTAGAIGDVL
jgi:hypothetical protein